MISDVLSDAICRLDSYLRDEGGGYQGAMRARILACRAEMDSIRRELDAPPSDDLSDNARAVLNAIQTWRLSIGADFIACDKLIALGDALGIEVNEGAEIGSLVRNGLLRPSPGGYHIAVAWWYGQEREAQRGTNETA